MSIIRARQPALTRRFPHQGNKRFIVPNRPAVAPPGLETLQTINHRAYFGIESRNELVVGNGSSDLSFVDPDTGNVTDTIYSGTWPGLTDGRIEGVYPTWDDNFILAVVREANAGATQNFYYTFQVDVSSLPATPVKTLDNGDDELGTQHPYGGVLGRNSLQKVKLWIGGAPKDCIIYAEYRTGTVDISLACWYTDDNGATWSKFWRQNNAGAYGTGNNANMVFKHNHAVYQNPYELDSNGLGKIMVCCGDSDSSLSGGTGLGNADHHASVVMGPADPVAWAAIDNQGTDDIVDANFTVGVQPQNENSQRWRWIDAVFYNGQVITGSDSATSSPWDGVLRFDSDLTDGDAEQPFTPPHNVSNLSLTCFIKMGNTLIAGDYIHNTGVTDKIWYSTSRDGVNWASVAYHEVDSTANSGAYMDYPFIFKGSLYLSADYMVSSVLLNGYGTCTQKIGFTTYGGTGELLNP